MAFGLYVDENGSEKKSSFEIAREICPSLPRFTDDYSFFFYIASKLYFDSAGSAATVPAPFTAPLSPADFIESGSSAGLSSAGACSNKLSSTFTAAFLMPKPPVFDPPSFLAPRVDLPRSALGRGAEIAGADAGAGVGIGAGAGLDLGAGLGVGSSSA